MSRSGEIETKNKQQTIDAAAVFALVVPLVSTGSTSCVASSIGDNDMLSIEKCKTLCNDGSPNEM
jgi:ABC-type proline/glycine betaine transport system permease subunit